MFIIGALKYAGNKDIVNFKKIIEFTHTDESDLLLNAEYEYSEKRIPHFNNELGNEKIKASRYYRV
jgi:hypothetical protein